MLVVLVSTLLLSAEPAPPVTDLGPPVIVTATPRTQANAPRPMKVANNGDPLICWVEKPVGSHILQTVCATLDELDRAKRDADAALDSRNVGPLGGGGAGAGSAKPTGRSR